MSDTLSAIVSTARRGKTHPALYIGVAGDSPRTPSSRITLRGLDRIELRRGDARTIERTRVDGAEVGVISLADARMSSQHARLSRVGGAWILEDQGAKNGTWIG
ncbi:MAG: FHA domain-containing protein, partial [Polyangiales bacterium]